MLEPALGNVPAAFRAFPGHTGSPTCAAAAASSRGHFGMRRWDPPADDSSSSACSSAKCPHNLLQTMDSSSFWSPGRCVETGRACADFIHHR